ncbi:MAG: hypothetical protein E4G98_07125 [Promethearchaeota archaeon]|nr:MAG: hypothetical protein E4G98_07125 [Candidatus Lokiarchaeota archaeon]
MTSILRYLVIIQPTGLPLFAQSFDFTSDQACESFNHKLEKDSEKKELLGGMFQALTGLAYEVIEDTLQQINLEFDTFRIIALLVNKYLFLGIFENDGVNKKIEAIKSLELLNTIATAFLKKYPEELIKAFPVMPEHFIDFTEEIAKLNIPIASQNCRNCLTRCKDHEKGCFPHMVYFDKTVAYPNSAELH